MTHKKIQIVLIVQGVTNEVILLQTCHERGSFWQNITGSVEDGENYLEAAQRELLEETGIFDSDVISLNHEITFMSERGLVIESCFMSIFNERPAIKISSEHQAFKFIDATKLAASDYRFISNFHIAEMALTSLAGTK